MALPDLASVMDLSARGVDTSETLETMLTVASALVRQAAGSPILETESTVSLWLVEPSEWVDLPGQPVSAVASVTADGDEVTDAVLAHGRLWLGASRIYAGEPVELVVEMTHGFAEVPADIVQLVCDLAILGANTAADGALDPRVIAESIDDYSVTFSPSAGAVASAMTLPPAVRHSLRARFGGGVALVSQR